MSRRKVLEFFTAERRITPLVACLLLVSAGFFAGAMNLVAPGNEQSAFTAQAATPATAPATAPKIADKSTVPDTCEEAKKQAKASQIGTDGEGKTIVTKYTGAENARLAGCFGARYVALNAGGRSNDLNYVCQGRDVEVVFIDGAQEVTARSRSDMNTASGKCNVTVLNCTLGPNRICVVVKGTEASGGQQVSSQGAVTTPVAAVPVPDTQEPNKILSAMSGETPDGATTVSATGEKTYELKDGVHVEVKDGETRVVDDETGNVANLKENETVAQALERMGNGESDENFRGNPLTTKSDVGAILNDGLKNGDAIFYAPPREHCDNPLSCALVESTDAQANDANRYKVGTTFGGATRELGGGGTPLLDDYGNPLKNDVTGETIMQGDNAALDRAVQDEQARNAGAWVQSSEGPKPLLDDYGNPLKNDVTGAVIMQGDDAALDQAVQDEQARHAGVWADRTPTGTGSPGEVDFPVDKLDGAATNDYLNGIKNPESSTPDYPHVLNQQPKITTYGPGANPGEIDVSSQELQDKQREADTGYKPVNSWENVKSNLANFYNRVDQKVKAGGDWIVEKLGYTPPTDAEVKAAGLEPVNKNTPTGSGSPGEVDFPVDRVPADPAKPLVGDPSSDDYCWKNPGACVAGGPASSPVGDPSSDDYCFKNPGACTGAGGSPKVPATPKPPVVVPPPGGGGGGGGGNGGGGTGGGTSGGGGSGAGSGMMSFLGGLAKGLGGALGGNSGNAPTCPTDPQQYQQYQQQYNQQLQQYNQQLQQLNYQQSLYGYNPNAAAPQAPQPCKQGSGGSSQCPATQPQPAANTCAGTWRQTPTPLATGAVCPVWQCVAERADMPTAQLTCEPGTAERGAQISISYSCANATSATGFGFTTNGALTGATSTVLTDPPANAASINFALKCERGTVSVGAQCSVQIARTNIVLKALPSAVVENGTSRIGWVTTGMSSCVVSSPDQPEFTARNAQATSTSGIATTSPITRTSQFDLRCTSVTGTVFATSTTVKLYRAGTVASSLENRTNVQRGTTGSIQWSFPEAPDVSAVSLWLVDVEAERVVALIAGQRARTGAYTWNLPDAGEACNTQSALVCAQDLIPGRAYTIQASSYRPPNAGLGEFADPSLPEPEYLESILTDPFKISQ